jgi:hypothetical protein
MPPASKDVAATPRAPRALRTVPGAREAFLATVRRDTPGTDLARYTAVIDALLAWSAERPSQLAFRADATAADTISFGRTGAGGVFWAVRPARGAAPTLEIAPPAGASLADPDRARAMDTINAHSRAVLAPGDRLRIGFGALKNAAALAAVLALLDSLLTAQAPADGAASDAPPTAQDAGA